MLNLIKQYLQKAKKEAVQELYRETVPDDTDPALSRPASWTGVDLDGTLAYYDRFLAPDKIGEPVPAMLSLLKKMIRNGIRIKIFTARAQDPEQLPKIRKWLKDNGLPELEITNVKDYYMQRLYDDRCIQVERNTGRLVK